MRTYATRQDPELGIAATADDTQSPERALVCTRLYEILARSNTVLWSGMPLPDGEDERTSIRLHQLVYLILLASNPMVYTPGLQRYLSHHPPIMNGKPCWPRSDFFICTSDVSLDLRSQQGRLVEDITKDLFESMDLVHDTVYGAVCGHDAVIALRVDNVQSRSLYAWHISFDIIPLQTREDGFLDFDAVIPLIARLGQSHQCSASLVWGALSILNQSDTRNMDAWGAICTPPVLIFPLFSMPPELVALVVYYLDDEDLLNFALASHITALAVHGTSRILFPWIARYRLVAIRHIQLTPEIAPGGQVIHPENDIQMPYAAFVTENDEVLFVGFGFDDDALQSLYVRSSASGMLMMPFPFFSMARVYISVPFAVIPKDVLEDLERDATREGLFGRMKRRRERLITTWTEQYEGWVSNPTRYREKSRLMTLVFRTIYSSERVRQSKHCGLL